MPHSTASSAYTRTNTSPDRPSSVHSTSTVATTRSEISFRRKPLPNQRKSRPRSTPGNWNSLLGIPQDDTGAGSSSSRQSSVDYTESYLEFIAEARAQNDKSPAMGTNRTSVAINGPNEAKRKTQTYEEQYQYKDNAYGSARERVHRESPVIAELRTNVIIKDEFTLVTDMSYHLAARYSRPDSSIMINVDHSSCLALAGTFEPCYILTISTVPSQLQATTNKRNAALIQSFMADILSVPPERGIIKFVPVPEENYAFNGTTLLGSIERLEQQQFGGNGAVKRAITDARKSMPVLKKSSSKLDADFAKKADQADGFDGQIEEMQNGSILAPLRNGDFPDVFELASAKEEQRPSTSHGTSSNATFAAMNGLRMNGVARSDLEGPSTRTSFGRPKTIAGGPVWASAEQPEPLPRRGSDDAAPPPIVRPEQWRQQSAKDQPPKSSPVESKARSANGTAAAPQKSVPPTNTNTNAEKTKPAYLETAPKPALAKNHSRKNSKSPEALPQDDGTAANMAKRRSTVSAMPAQQKAPQPPPVPESKQTKVSKRKSFLSAFRR